ncbi:MAG: hypothetical protein JXA66_04920 [Oligoflexia bacterium]|nr:hypothetical protein [Oligoflexia bacterium]
MDGMFKYINYFILLIFCFPAMAEIRPLDYDRFAEFTFTDSTAEFIEYSTPKNLRAGDDLKTIGLKFLVHNLKQLKRNLRKAPAIRNSQAVEKVNSYVSYYREIVTPSTSVKFEEGIDAEFRLKADLPHRYLKFRMISDVANGEVVYHASGNRVVLSLSRNLSSAVELSLVDTRELSNKNNMITVNFSYNF